MKLAFIIFNYFPFGGLQRDFLRIAEGCHARGHTVDVYTMEWCGDQPPWLRLHLCQVKGFTNYGRANRFVKQLLGFIKKEQDYDLVIGFNRMPGLDIYYAGDVCFKYKYMSRPFARLTPRYRVFQGFEAAVFAPKSTTRVICIAAKERDNYLQAYRTPPERLYLLPPGIAKEIRLPANAAKIRQEMRAELKVENAYLLLSIASSFNTKGIDRALRAVSSLSKECAVKFIVIGGDRHRKKYEVLAKKLGIGNKVSFLGARKEVLKYLLAADMLVHPARHESAGIVLLEALLTGLPILTTAICGYASYIRDADAGKILPTPFGQKDLNNMLADMLNRQRLSQWQENAIAYTKQHDFYNFVDNAVDLIEQIARLTE